MKERDATLAKRLKAVNILLLGSQEQLLEATGSRADVEYEPGRLGIPRARLGKACQARIRASARRATLHHLIAILRYIILARRTTKCSKVIVVGRDPFPRLRGALAGVIRSDQHKI